MLYEVITKSQDYQCRLTISPIELCEVLKHIRKLCVEIADKSLGYDCMLQAGITELVIMLCRIYKLKNQSSNISRMNAVISYIESNFLSPITVEKLLTICQMSRRNFFRKFKHRITSYNVCYTKLLRPLPQGEFDACITKPRTSDKMSLINFDNVRYSVPDIYAYKQDLIVKGFWDRVEIYTREGDFLARHQRCYQMHAQSLDPFHYLTTLSQKPGVLDYGLRNNFV